MYCQVIYRLVTFHHNYVIIICYIFLIIHVCAIFIPGIVGVAVDTPSVDYGQADIYPVHVLLCNHNLYLLENVKDTCLLPPIGATLTSLPSKIKGSSGAATRVFASWTFSVSRAGRVHYRFKFVVVLLTLITTYLP